MRIIACVDDRYGMLFNQRRVSSDQFLIPKLYAMTKDAPIWMDGYTAKLFPEAENRHVTAEPLHRLPDTVWYFWERGALPEDTNLEEVLLVWWNRKYPADAFFPKERLKKMQLVETVEFPGNSHDKIRIERYQA